MRQTAVVTSDSYNDFLRTMALPDQPLFLTDADLWPIYLDSFGQIAERQYHNCHACRQFIERFGSLVTIDEQGRIHSAVWNPENAPDNYRPAITAMKKMAEIAGIRDVFLSKDRTLGTPITGQWTHYAVENPRIYRRSLLTPGQAMAAKKEDYRNISRALAEFNLNTLEQVVELLQSDSLYRSEKILRPAEWLYNLKCAVDQAKQRQQRKNIIWRAIADAPDGFCHPRSGMIGTLLDDLGNGLPFADAARKFAAKMHPLSYQRPQAAPTAGAIAVAEKRVKELGVERSLTRRYAMPDDMQTIWTPPPVAPSEESAGGVFGHLRAGAVNPLAAASGNVTWEKFRRDVLPKARKIDVFLPAGRSQFIVFVAPVHADAPVIFQWDNAVSWYHWHGGSFASDFLLDSGWIAATAICLPPYMWTDQNITHYGNNFAMILQGARETKNAGNAIFPGTLKAEFHDIRSVIEAHSQRSKIQAVDGDHVIGKGLGSRVRVHTSVITEYTIDRWD